MVVAVQAQELTRRFDGFVAVDRVSFSVAEGERYGYLGLNGAGKSTTIKMLTTLLPPTSGIATVAGHDVRTEPLAVRRVVGLVGDEGGPEARPTWNAREYLRYFARLHRLRNPREEVEAALDAMGLESEARRRPIGTYSTGMKRRVEVARSLLGRPRVIFLDEPTRGLDLPAKREMWEFLRQLSKEEKVTMFVSSHEVPEIQALCERLSVIAHGRLTFSGTTNQLGTDPAQFEAALIRLLQGSEEPASKPRKGFRWSTAGR